MRVKRNRSDIPVSLVDRDFVLDFEAYLKVDDHLQANSAEKLMRIFKRITTMRFKSGLMAKDPFCNVRLKKVKLLDIPRSIPKNNNLISGLG